MQKDDVIYRQAAIDALAEQIALCDKALNTFGISMKDEYAVKVEKASLVAYKEQLESIPSAQPEIIRCKDCEYGKQDEVGRWFCRSLGCQIGNEDGSGYCADALNRKEGAKDD